MTGTASSEVRRIGLAPGQSNYRILVVDDEADNRLLLLDLLTSAGFSVQQASNGREATEIWQAWQPHLIWMDLRMPQMDGCEATQWIRQMEAERRKDAVTQRTKEDREQSNAFPPCPPDSASTPLHTKIIALTASVFKGKRDTTLASGFDDFVIKPFQESVIWSKMSQYLGVELIYQQSAKSNEEGLQKTISIEQVSAADLKDMPSGWLAELNQASSQLKGKQVMQLIKQIPPEQGAIAAKLQTLAENYQFDEIVRLLNFSEG